MYNGLRALIEDDGCRKTNLLAEQSRATERFCACVSSVIVISFVRASVTHMHTSYTFPSAFSFKNGRKDSEQWDTRTAIHAKCPTSEAGRNHKFETEGSEGRSRVGGIKGAARGMGDFFKKSRPVSRNASGLADSGLVECLRCCTGDNCMNRHIFHFSSRRFKLLRYHPNSLLLKLRSDQSWLAGVLSQKARR